MAVRGAVMVPHPPLIIPAVGRGSEKEIRETVEAYDKAAQRMASLKPETVVVISPHSVMYADYIHISPGQGASGDFGRFRAPEVSICAEYDVDFVRELCRKAKEQGLAAGTEGGRAPHLDHGTMIPLYFFGRYQTDYRLVRIGISGLPAEDHYRLGQCIRDTAEKLGRRTVVIGSGDLSHKLKEDGPYGYSSEGPVYDKKIMDVMGRGVFGELFRFGETFCEKAAECGHRSFLIMAGAMDGCSVEAEALSYEGPFGVGYGICTYEVCGKDPKRDFLDQYEEEKREKASEKRRREDAYVSLARKSTEYYVRTGEILRVPEGLPQELYDRRAGAFVSLKTDGRLRGCIGTISAVRDSLAEEIIENAVSAASRDPRFEAVRPEELEQLEYSVDVLGDAEVIGGPEELDVKRYGVIVSRGYRRGLLLPDLEGVDTVEEQIAIAKRKAGIPEDAEDVRLERFEVVRHCV